MSEQNDQSEKSLAKKEEGARPPIMVGARGLQVRTVEELYRLAVGMVKGGIAPKGMTPEGAMAVMAFGMELGLTQIQSLKDIAFINGRPCMYGDAISALLLASGKLEDLPNERYEGEGENRTAICILKRKGMATPMERRFSTKDAKTAGLLAKGGNWVTYPDRMLRWRAFGWAARDAFADVLKGLWVREEAEDIVEATGYTVADPGAPQTTAVQFSEGWKGWCGVRSLLSRDEMRDVLAECGIERLTPETDEAVLKRATEIGLAMVQRETTAPPAAGPDAERDPDGEGGEDDGVLVG